MHITSPNDATRLGIETVYQDLALCDNLDVVANLYLGREAQQTVVPGLVKQLDETQMEARTNQILRQLDVKIPSVRTIVASLSGGQRQSIAVAKTVLRDPAVLLLDEPTAALGVAQTRQVLNLIRRLREQGLAVVMISHNLADVFEVADRVVVLRLGRRVGSFDIGATSSEQIVAAITGAEFGGIMQGASRDGRPARGIGGGAMSSETLDTQELVPPPPARGLAPSECAHPGVCAATSGRFPSSSRSLIIAVYFQIRHRRQLPARAQSDRDDPGDHHDRHARPRVGARPPRPRDRSLARQRERARGGGDGRALLRARGGRGRLRS